MATDNALHDAGRTAARSIRWLSACDITRVLPPDAARRAVGEALAQLKDGRVEPWPRHRHRTNEQTLLLMPGHVSSGTGIKIVTIVEGNSARGLPTIQGLMVSFDGATGQPLSVLDGLADGGTHRSHSGLCD